MKLAVPTLEEWQIAFITKEFYDLAEFFLDSAITNMRVRVWSNKYLQLGLNVLLDQLEVTPTDRKKIFYVLANQPGSFIQADHMSSIGAFRDLNIQFDFAKKEYINIDLPRDFDKALLSKRDALLELISQSLLVMLRLPAPRHTPTLIEAQGGEFLMKNKAYLENNQIELVFSTETTEVAEKLKSLGGVEFNPTHKSTTKYVRFNSKQSWLVFSEWIQRRPTPIIGELGFKGAQLLFQFTVRRMAF